MSSVRTGLDRFRANPPAPLRGRRVGVIANPTAVAGDLRHIVDILVTDLGLDVRMLFGPEHGLRGDAQDMIGVGDQRDSQTGLPVMSLYGDTEDSLVPTADALDTIDVMIFDIQDIGSRYYTYVWTMVLAMRACADAGKSFVVLDRPNPLGGAVVEGPGILEDFTSFVGLVDVANRHGLTAGEIALWRRREEALDLDLHVVEVDGWQREMYYDQIGIPWVMPSPNMPTLDTAVVYPGGCLIEGTMLSEGRGTTRPFELVGAPYVAAERLASELSSLALAGVVFRPLYFRPTFQKHAGKVCGGVQLHITERDGFRPYRTYAALIHTVKKLWPREFSWRDKPYEFVTDKPAIDLLTGSQDYRVAVDGGAALADILDRWSLAEESYRRLQQGLRRY